MPAMLLLCVVYKGQRKHKKFFWWYFSSRYACWNVWVYGRVSSKEIDNKTMMLMSMSHCPFFPRSFSFIPYRIHPHHPTFYVSSFILTVISSSNFTSISPTIVNHYKGQRIYREGEVMTCIYAYWDWLSADGLLVLFLRRLWNIFTSLWSNFPDLHLENVERRRKKTFFLSFPSSLTCDKGWFCGCALNIHKGRKSHERIRSILDCVWRECFHRSFTSFSIFFWIHNI